jgi:hypothetical protein
MALICMGRDVAFVLKSGHEFSASRKRDGMLYDGSGHYWPRCSLLIAPFENGTSETDDGRDYFGRDSAVYEGRINLPPRSLKSWRNLGEIKDVYYDRAGTKANGPFHHAFHKPRGVWKLIWPFKRKTHGPAILYAYKGFYRIELPEGCIVDDRGIVLP